jgi:hypothetical protein
MTLPPIFYVKAFWEFLSYVLAGVLGLLWLFGVIGPEFVWSAATILSWVLGFLKFFKIEPELRARVALTNPKKSKK